MRPLCFACCCWRCSAPAWPARRARCAASAAECSPQRPRRRQPTLQRPRAAPAGLFGGVCVAARRDGGRAALQLRLLACFLARREDRSAALIAVAGRSQRFLPGAEVRPGTVLLAVHRDHVVLRDRGYEERLYFPKAEGAETTHATL
ncbi:pilus assembly protein PilZ [Pseudomonas aeruginosa]|uniref:type II secretion system protein N n=1 Tax=Pseudomonas aeruginosa TaxID=287 RepID=UPI00193BD3EE|nr:type II secretion system protein N [Pseudomonas aeruginosa]MBM2498728.1 pilus assembly protein PilZ [Pseudomonas aeruginosa]